MQDLHTWAVALRQRHLRALVAHPHHYVVAGIITLVVWCLGHWEAGVVMTTWAYAILENLTTLGDE